MYHGQHSNSSLEFGRSGLLQQALVLEMAEEQFNSLQVKTVSWNGQLPMLDLFYLVKHLAESGPGLQLSQVSCLCLVVLLAITLLTKCSFYLCTTGCTCILFW